MNVLAICGSLRKQSFNGAALRALCSAAPDDFTVAIRHLDDIPMYSQDDFDRDGRPPGVAALCAQIEAADGVIVATPEYLYSMPGVLKNALDWTNGKPSVFSGKPVAILSAAANPYGGVRAQQELRKVLHAVRAFVLPAPELFIGGARTKFDADGNLVDPATRDSLRELVVAFGDWIQLRAGAHVPDAVQ